MLTGHAYSRALRAHVLAHVALAKIVFNEIQFTADECALLENLLEVDNLRFLDNIEDESVKKVLHKFSDHLTKFRNNGPTSKLWIQYFDMVTLIKQFIKAELYAACFNYL